MPMSTSRGCSARMLRAIAQCVAGCACSPAGRSPTAAPAARCSTSAAPLGPPHRQARVPRGRAPPFACPRRPRRPRSPLAAGRAAPVTTGITGVGIERLSLMGCVSRRAAVPITAPVPPGGSARCRRDPFRCGARRPSLVYTSRRSGSPRPWVSSETDVSAPASYCSHLSGRPSRWCLRRRPTRRPSRRIRCG